MTEQEYNALTFSEKTRLARTTKDLKIMKMIAEDVNINIQKVLAKTPGIPEIIQKIYTDKEKTYKIGVLYLYESLAKNPTITPKTLAAMYRYYIGGTWTKTSEEYYKEVAYYGMVNLIKNKKTPKWMKAALRTKYGDL
jgi:hypothetical protein